MDFDICLLGGTNGLPLINITLFFMVQRTRYQFLIKENKFSRLDSQLPEGIKRSGLGSFSQEPKILMFRTLYLTLPIYQHRLLILIRGATRSFVAHLSVSM